MATVSPGFALLTAGFEAAGATGSAASLEAEIKERFQAKTHTIFVGRVRHAEVVEADPMVYKAGHFFDGARLEEL